MSDTSKTANTVASADERRQREPHIDERVQCSNCCQLAPIVGRSLGLVFYACELCGTRAAVSPDEVVRPMAPSPR